MYQLVSKAQDGDGSVLIKNKIVCKLLPVPIRTLSKEPQVSFFQKKCVTLLLLLLSLGTAVRLLRNYFK